MRKQFLGIFDTRSKTFSPEVVSDERGLVSLHQDFSGGLSQAQLLNLAYQIIREIADLKDYLRAFANNHGHDAQDVEATIDGCLDLALIIDLANADKHSASARPNEQRSKRSPKLVDVKRVLQAVLRQPRPGATFGLQMTPDGVRIVGGGATSVVVTGDIVDDKGVLIRVLPFAQLSAIEAWQQLLTRWGVSVGN